MHRLRRSGSGRNEQVDDIEALVSARDLTKRFETFRAVDGV